ncbi:hypothetical protein E2C01_063346 [Portunus trituberculatus]|uniref:Ecdysteroid UDP-glucosyltransferase n=1 Tax=Portunus trituberculatus TaxID=210409 RepID=A0A5B7H8X6_PORTR|nr:hypothetical protein [Portunus trituberculatus]
MGGRGAPEDLQPSPSPPRDKSCPWSRGGLITQCTESGRVMHLFATLVVVVASAAVSASEQYRVLIVTPVASRSQYHLCAAIAEGLGEAGHEVTFVSSFKLKHTSKIVYIFTVLPVAQSIVQDYFPGMPPIETLYENSSLTLINGHFSIDGQVPLLPTQVEIGTISTNKPRPLPQVRPVCESSLHC